MQRILIVDDDPTICLMLKSFLSRKGYDSDTVFSAGEAVKALDAKKYSLILSDYRLPDFDGLELLGRIKKIDARIPVIIMTSYADIRTAVQAIKIGAFEYVAKPLNPEEILVTIKAALKRYQAASEKDSEKKELQFVDGNSVQAQHMHRYIELVAPTDMSVIIEGESGTGKEIAARKIHVKSKRSSKTFVAVDCGALSTELSGSELFGHMKGAFTGAIANKEGQFEVANGGTLFLDEIGNLSYEVQVKLLRAIQERKVRRVGGTADIDVDVRIIVATNEDLVKAVERGDFREDLYHRLNEFKIGIPSLKERQDDISLFADFFLKQSNIELSKEVQNLAPKVLKIFKDYSWPGNLREMKNVIRRAVLLAQDPVITEDCLPFEIIQEANNPVASTSDLKVKREIQEKDQIIQTLEQTKGNKAKAARLLNIDRKTLYNKLKQYNIKA
ncbi:sigma-54-dependent Fis family transcriptional regulator [Puteibacter caeruleilacunae]|nr:sigma-54-dependent Fis family transcriptional regulator [Puteibacter caeruleilacunae]